MLSTRSVNHCSPSRLQPLLSLRFMSCAAGKHGAGGAVPRYQPPRSHSSRQACTCSLPAAPAVRTVPPHPLSPLRGPGCSRAGGTGTSQPCPWGEPGAAWVLLAGRWEEADTPPCLLAEPTCAPSADADARECSKAALAWVGKHINYGLFSRGCPLVCRNRCLA